MDYLEIAKRTMNFINTRKRKGPEGIFWSLEDAAKGRPVYYDEICMYAGASGILCFLLGLYDVTKDSTYLDEAKEAGSYLKYRWENEPELKRNFSKYAFSNSSRLVVANTCSSDGTRLQIFLYGSIKCLNNFFVITLL